MATRLLILITGLLWLAGLTPAHAQVPDPPIPSGNWWRLCASLDMDFYNDRYYINHNTTCDGTTGTAYSGSTYGTNVTNFIAATGATFTRAGSTTTANSTPFYLSSIQTFLNRASVTNNVTSTFAPFYTNASQNWVSRSAGTTSITSTSAPFYMTSAGQAFASRASSGTYFDGTGTLQTASTNVARNATYSYNGSAWVANSGTLIEPAATNYLRYNTMGGAVAGTPGTPPTTWSVNAGNGITSSVVGTGTENGINYVDINYSGTTTATTYMTVQFANSAGIFPASVGQKWTMSGFVKLSAGSWGSYSNAPGWIINEYGTSFNVQAGNTFSSLPTGANLATQRYAFTYTISSPSTTYLNTYFSVGYASGTAVNFTVRLGMPQMEQSPYATSVIATTGNSSVTRAADAYTEQTATYFDNTGTLQYAASGAARSASYYYSGGSWVTAAANTLPPQAISSITDSSGTATVTTGAAHGLAVGNSVTLANNYPANYNGTFTVASVPSSTTFTYTMTTDPGVSASQIGNYTTTATTPAVLVEPAATNGVRNNTMVGVVVADGIERTNNGTFSTSSGNVCTGSDTSSGNSLSCSNGTAVTAQSITGIAYTGSTATVTTGSAHGLSVGNIVTMSGVGGTSAASFNGTFMITAVPSSTTFKYTMVVPPTAAATITGSSYTATVGGWAGTVNSGTGSLTASSGNIALTGDGTNAASIYEQISTISGYKYTVIVTTGSGNNITVQAGTSIGITGLLNSAGSASTTNYYQFTATSTTSYLQINNFGATTANITSVSVQSAGAIPTNWSTQNFGGNIAVNVVGTGTENNISYVDIQFVGIPAGSGADAIFFEGFGAQAASFGQIWTSSLYLKLSAGSLTNISSMSNLQQVGNTSGNYVGGPPNLSGYSNSIASVSSNPLSQDRFVSPQIISGSTLFNTANIRSGVSFGVAAGAAINMTLRVGMPQLEQSSYATSVIPTSGSITTRAADVYNQQPASYIDGTGTLQFSAANTARVNHNAASPYASLGTLIEPAATNSIRNNMMVGAVAADGVERTNNGTFSTSGANVCTGADTSSGNSLSCSNGTAVTAASISSITVPNGTSTTATVTTGAAHNLAVGNIVTVSGALPAAYNGTYMVVTVPSSTTFTYTTLTAPATNATTVGTYTATAGGWAGTVNGGTGTVTGASGSMTLTGDGTNGASAYMAIPTVSGYRYTIAITNGAGNAVTVQAGNSIGGTNLLAASTVAASTTTYYQFQPSGTTSYVQINNTSATAASVTTVSVQSAGLFPTDVNVGVSNGLAYSIVGTGTTSTGINYIDLKLAGTALTSGENPVSTDTGAFAASVGQSWTHSAYLQIVGGSTTNINYIYLEIQEQGGAGQNDFSSNLKSVIPTSGSLGSYRASYTATLSQSGTTQVHPYMSVEVNSGLTVNVTLRIGMPQLEQNSYGTSVIPTFGSAVTRTADVYNQPVGTYFNSSGTLISAANNTPRMDHSPTGNYAPQGILIEESRTNLVSSSAYANSSWFAGQATVTNNSTTAPDGTTTAILLKEDTSNNQHLVSLYPTVTANTTYTGSIYVKAYNSDNIALVPFDNTDGNFGESIIFNPSTGTVASAFANTNGSTNAAYTVQALPNGWYRISVTGTPSVASYSFQIELRQSSNNTYSYTGNGTSGVYIWGAQLEAGSFPTSYIPTSGSTVTRNADVFTLPVTAGGGWYSSGVGTLLVNAMVPVVDSLNYHRFAVIDDGTVNNRIQLSESSGNLNAGISTGGTSPYNALSSSVAANTLIRGALSYNSSNIYAAYQGSSYTSGTGTIPTTLSVLSIGNCCNGAYQLDGWDLRITYFPIQHPNASLPQF